MPDNSLAGSVCRGISQDSLAKTLLLLLVGGCGRVRSGRGYNGLASYRCIAADASQEAYQRRCDAHSRPAYVDRDGMMRRVRC